MSARRYLVEVAGRSFAVEIDGQGDGRIVRVDGVELLASLERLAGGLTLARLGTRSVEALLQRRGEQTEIALRGRVVTARVRDERAERLAEFGGSRAAKHGAQTLTAPMPGLVVAVNVAAGQAVERGQGLVVLQAMKMENELSSPRDATVKRVVVSAGQPVELGAVLVELE